MTSIKMNKGNILKNNGDGNIMRGAEARDGYAKEERLCI